MAPASLSAQLHPGLSKKQLKQLEKEAAPAKPDTICTDLKNGRQLIVVNHEGARQRYVNQLEATRPRALSWDALTPPSPPNEYYFRDQKGRVTLAYNSKGKNFPQLSRLFGLYQCRTSHTVFSGLRHSRYRTRQDDIPGYVRVFSIHSYDEQGVLQPEEENGLTGLIDPEGTLVLPLAYQSIHAAGNDFLVNQAGKWGVLSREKAVLVPFEYDAVKQPSTRLLLFYSNGLLMCSYQVDDHTIQNYKGIEFIREDDMDQLGQSEGYPLALYRLKDKIGFADSRLQLITPAIYSYAAGFFRNGLSPVCRDGKWGYINAAGKEQIACRFDDAMPFEGSAAVVHQDGRRFCINAKGEAMSDGCDKLYYEIDLQPTWRDERMDGQPFRFAEKGQLKGVVNAAGKVVIPFIYESGHCLFKKYSANKCRPEYAVVRRMGKWGVLRQDGVEVVPCMYDEVNEHGGGDRYIVVQNKIKKYPQEEYRVGLIDDSTFSLVIACEYEALNPNNVPGHIAFMKNRKWGWMTPGKKVIVAPVYDNIGWMKDGRVPVVKDSLSGMLDSTGRVVIAPRYKAMGRFFTKGLIPVSIGGKWGYADTLAREVIPFAFDEARDFGKSLAGVKAGKMFGFIDSLGNAVTPFHFDFINYNWEPDGLIEVKMGGKYGFADESGQVVIPCIYDDVRGYNREGHAVMKNGQMLRVKRPGGK